MFEKGFKPSKCKSLLKLVISRIALVRNKRGAQIRQLRKDVAQLLQSGQELSARKRVDIIMKEQNILDAYAVLEKFCELVLTRLAVIKAERSCPLDTKEAISSLIFAGSRCADLPELLDLRSIFEEHYGKQFIVAAAELQSGSGVNKVIIEKLSGRMLNEDLRVQLMKDIAAENRVQWSPQDSDMVLHSHVGLKSDQIENQKYPTGLVNKTSKDKPNVESNIPTASERGAVSPAPHAADVEQVQFIPFVSSERSSPPSRVVQEQRQFIPFVPFVSIKPSPPTSFIEAKTLDWEKDVSNLNRHKTRQSAQGLRTERETELLADKLSNHNLSFTQERMPNQDGDVYMQARSEMSKHIDGLACAEEILPTLPRKKHKEQHGANSFESGKGAEADSGKESDKRMDVSVEATIQHPQKFSVNKTEFYASQLPMTKIKTGSTGKDVKENVDRSSASADALPSFKPQPKPERTEKVSENESQQRRSKNEVDLNWTSGKESARRSSGYEDNLAQSEERESITNETLTRRSKYQDFQTPLQNQTEQPVRIIKHFSTLTSSESDDNSALIQRPSTRNARWTASSNFIKESQETSAEDEPNLDPSVFRNPRLSSPAQEGDVVHKGSRSDSRRHKPHEKEVLQDSSRVERVYKTGEIHSSNQEIESNDNDTEDLVVDSLKKGVARYRGRSKLKEHYESADMGAYVSGKSTFPYCGSDEDPLHQSSSANTVVQKIPVHFDGDDKSHFDEYNKHNLGEQSERMKREQFLVAKKHKLDYENDLQTRVGTQDSRRNCIEDKSSPYAYDISTEKNEWLKPRTKHSDESGFQAAVTGVLADRTEVAHRKLKWHSPSQEQQDTSSEGGRIQPLNAFDLQCEAEEVHSQDSHPTVQQFPIRKMETAKADKQEAVNPSLVRSKRTTGISVRSRLPGKTDESSKPKPAGQGGTIASNQYIEANDSNDPDTKYVQNIWSELPADVNPNQCASFEPPSALYLPLSRPSNETKDKTSSEANDVQKTSRDQNSTKTPPELISAQHYSTRQPTASYLPTAPLDEAKSTYRSGADQVQKGLRHRSPSPRTQRENSPVQYASSRQSAASNLPTAPPLDEAKSTYLSGADQVQKGLRHRSPSPRTQVENSPVQYASSRQSAAPYLPKSYPGLKAMDSTFAEVSDAQKALSYSPFSDQNHADSSPPEHPSSKLTPASNFPSSRPQITKIQTETCLSDDDLMTRFQALKAQLH
ncbi:hypothetical protein O6H91_02G019100 [Diphasiastrum complanatum]|uniref:Uncharacterized protein n=1 Tax=Diphasiastrum complanatum TaxID=34168 RepID=A0ACC2EDD9_DIPCM|nr:hypothetical protein O6H91_02G019100 [Diphasiastrum complanatum]